MKIALFNDTGIVPHIGCMAVSDAHIRMLANINLRADLRWFVGDGRDYWLGNRQSSLDKLLASPLCAELESVDAVIVNGEGTIHHGNGIHLLTILEAAQHLGKKSLLVNAVLQETECFDDVLAKLSDLTVRDLRSSEFLRQREITHRVVVDSILEAEFEEGPLFDLSNRIVVSDWHPDKESDVGSALRSLMADSKLHPFFLPLIHGIHRYIWRKIPSTLSSADLLITARHHGIYLAALAGIPFVALPGNTHKIEGLIELSGFDIPICTRIDQVESAMIFAKRNRNIFNDFNHWLLSKRPLTTFQNLGPSSKNISVDSALIKEERCRFEEAVFLRNPQDLLADNWNLWPAIDGIVNHY